VGGHHPDPDEVLEARMFSPQELLSLARQGQLRDAKTLAGLVLAGALHMSLAAPPEP